MNFEPMDEMQEFEEELRQSLVRRAAPVSLKRNLMARRNAPRPHRLSVVWQRLAAALVLIAILGGAAEWEVHVRQERREGEAVREQVLTALRITNHALDQMNRQLAQHNRPQE